MTRQTSSILTTDSDDPWSVTKIHLRYNVFRQRLHLKFIILHYARSYKPSACCQMLHSYVVAYCFELHVCDQALDKCVELLITFDVIHV